MKICVGERKGGMGIKAKDGCLGGKLQGENRKDDALVPS